MPVPLKIVACAITSLSLLTITMACSAADDEPPTKKASSKEKPEDQADPAAKKEEDKPKEPSLLDKLSKDLLKDIDGESAKAEKENKLDRAAKGMRTAGEKLDEDRTDADTRKVQEQVIRDLDDLIKQLQNPPPSQGGGGGGSGGGGKGGAAGASGKMSQSRLQKMGAGQAQAQLGKGQSGQAQSGPGGMTNKPNGVDKKQTEGSSSERTESEKKAAEDAARKKKLEMDVWGHLPPHLREQLLNTYGERMLPKYQQMVKQFYEALSEQQDTAPRR